MTEREYMEKQEAFTDRALTLLQRINAEQDIVTKLELIRRRNVVVEAAAVLRKRYALQVKAETEGQGGGL